MSNIVPIRGRELISILEEWLEQARKGEITCIAFAALMSDETCCEGWAGDFDENVLRLFGAINILRDGFFHQNVEHYSSCDRGAID